MLPSAPRPQKPKVNYAYGSAPDDLADTGLVEPPKVNTVEEETKPEYNTDNAVAYAWEWWDDQNLDYYDYNEDYDCANFVSQCLAAGGFPMDDAWHSERGEYKGVMPIGDFPRLYEWDVTPSWSKAHAQFEYLSKLENTGDSGHFIAGEMKTAARSLKPGDVMYFDNEGDGVMNHAVIVTGIEGDMIYYTGHSNPREYEPVATFFKGAPEGKVYYVSMRID